MRNEIMNVRRFFAKKAFSTIARHIQLSHKAERIVFSAAQNQGDQYETTFLM